MKIKYIIILLLISMNASSQNYAFAVRNSEHQGYSILDNNGVERYELPRYAEPIFDGIIRSGSYPDLIKIPLYNQIYPIRYLGDFYLIDMSGEIISKLHENTEWVHPFKNGISRVTLKNYGVEEIFCDMYIDENGNNVFGKIFRDGNNFINGKAAIKYMTKEKWVIIDNDENELLNISALTDNPISVIVNIQEDVWKINFKNFEESLYLSISGQTSVNPKDLSEYKSNEINLNPRLKPKHRELTANSNYEIITNQSEISNKEDIKELILINPTEEDFSSISQFRNLEVLSIHKYEGESIDMNMFNSLELLESLNLFECRKLVPNSLNLNENNIEFLTIKRCNKLKNFSPDESKWKNLKMYTLRNIRRITGKEKKIIVGNKG